MEATTRSALLVAFGSIASTFAWGHGAHEHGVAQLDIALDGTELQIELDTPAVNLLGFEHAPRDARQEAVLGEAVDDLRDGARLFSLTPEARCVLRDARILSSLLPDDDGHDEGDHHAHDPDVHGGDGHDGDDHVDVFVAWRFDCAAPAELGELGAQAFFERFPGTERLRVQAVTARGQTAAVLTPSSPAIRL